VVLVFGVLTEHLVEDKTVDLAGRSCPGSGFDLVEDTVIVHSPDPDGSPDLPCLMVTYSTILLVCQPLPPRRFVAKPYHVSEV